MLTVFLDCAGEVGGADDVDYSALVVQALESPELGVAAGVVGRGVACWVVGGVWGRVGWHLGGGSGLLGRHCRWLGWFLLVVCLEEVLSVS